MEPHSGGGGTDFPKDVLLIAEHWRDLGSETGRKKWNFDLILSAQAAKLKVESLRFSINSMNASRENEENISHPTVLRGFQPEHDRFKSALRKKVDMLVPDKLVEGVI